MKPLDNSMSLLNELQANTLEPEYRQVAARGDKPSPIGFGLTLVLLVALLVVAALTTNKGSAEAASERDGLLQHIAEQQRKRDTLDSELTALGTQIRDLGAKLLTDPAARRELDTLQTSIGAVPVRGPGIVVVANDATNRTGTKGQVFDSDLSRLVNGLRQAGAEAIAINGRRVTTLTPIRSAGSAITVDYVSLSPPYRIEAIGNPATIQARFARTSAASWWNYIRDNYGIEFELQAANGELELAADPGMNLRFAEKVK